MKSISIFAMIALSSAMGWAQGAPPAGGRAAGGFGAGAQGRPADYLMSCKNQPAARAGGGGGGARGGRGAAAPASFDPKDYSVSAIPGVIAAGAKWSEVWSGD